VRRKLSETTDRVARWYIFRPKNPNLGKFWRGLGMKKAGILYEHLENIATIRYSFYDSLVIKW
jgi:hypothetical protein